MQIPSHSKGTTETHQNTNHSLTTFTTHSCDRAFDDFLEMEFRQPDINSLELETQSLETTKDALDDHDIQDNVDDVEIELKNSAHVQNHIHEEVTMENCEISDTAQSPALSLTQPYNSNKQNNNNPFLGPSRRKKAKIKYAQPVQYPTNHTPMNMTRVPQHQHMNHQLMQNPYFNQIATIHPNQRIQLLHSPPPIPSFPKMPTMIYHLPKPTNIPQQAIQRPYQ